ncbi:autophagy-related protein 27 [Xylariales sp. AK1849]|nr:autophagy-related protein 27 [Xylariales sp. AK1849]
MKFSQMPAPAEATAALLLLLVAPVSSMLHCNKIVADGRKFDLSALGGPHSVTVSRLVGPNYQNMTYTTDICRGLKRKGDVKKEEQCPHNTRVCAIERRVDKSDTKQDTFLEAIPIAGELKEFGGDHLDEQAINLSTSESNEDAKKQGVRLIVKGGWHTVNGQKRPQRAIIEFECDENREGTEGEWNPEDQYEPGDDPMRLRSVPDPLLYASEDEGGDGDQKPDVPEQLGDKNASLIFNSYGPLDSDKDVDVLRLTWKTKYACENRADEPSADEPSKHWGFFTWLVIIIFLGTASYLIFGSWLNYNRYGARGWDLLPHGDTIRDVPYLMKDWTRRVLNTVQGSGSRGGYSAV